MLDSSRVNWLIMLVNQMRLAFASSHLSWNNLHMSHATTIARSIQTKGVGFDVLELLHRFSCRMTSKRHLCLLHFYSFSLFLSFFFVVFGFWVAQPPKPWDDKENKIIINQIAINDAVTVAISNVPLFDCFKLSEKLDTDVNQQAVIKFRIRLSNYFYSLKSSIW